MVAASTVPRQNDAGARSVLVDGFGRRIDYLRLSVTEYCNLRCSYCMPAAGVPHVPHSELLSLDEISLLLRAALDCGVKRLRLTGGEPLVRRGFPELLQSISSMRSAGNGFDEVHLTTNGVLLPQMFDDLVPHLDGVNLSLDTLRPERYHALTRRDQFNAAMRALDMLKGAQLRLKINVVVQAGLNSDELADLALLARDHDLEVRFLEKMPFDGGARATAESHLDHKDILAELRRHFPDIESLGQAAHATVERFRVPGFRGRLGIIAGFSRTFCGSCNRLRITARGQIKSCLYGEYAGDVKQLLRSGGGEEEIQALLRRVVAGKARDGFAAEAALKARSENESMSMIGG